VDDEPGERSDPAATADASAHRFQGSRGAMAGTLSVIALMLSLPASALAVPGSAKARSAAAPNDRAATRALLEAEYRLAKATLARARTTEDAAAHAAETIGDECRSVLRGLPSSGAAIEGGPSPRPKPRPSARAQGEHARTELEKRTIDQEIDQTITAKADRDLRDPYDAYIATVHRLGWSNATITALVRQQAASYQEALAKLPVAACAEMRAWAASGFHRLPAGSKSFAASKQARDKRAVIGDLEELLRPYESLADRAIIRRTEAVEERQREADRASAVEQLAVYRMESTLGEKPVRFFEAFFGPVIARRHMQGVTIVIRASLGKNREGSCRHEVHIEFREGHGGSTGGLCLDQRDGSSLSSGCSGSTETIEIPTPPGVVRARVRLSNGRTLMVAIVKIPAKDGGPAGVFAGAFRGYNRYPVSMQELNSNGGVVRTIGLRKARCVKEPGGGESEGPQFVNLATVTSPYGEPLSIEAMLHRFQGQTEFSLISEAGVHSSESQAEPGKPKQFQWQLATECAPHPYTLLYGILTPPGASILVRTPTGLTPLTKIELSATAHAGGPLFYGIYTAPPTEIVVQNADGTILHTESLAAKAVEETEYCEGYAER
jgi:hypothetical protein